MQGKSKLLAAVAIAALAASAMPAFAKGQSSGTSEPSDQAIQTGPSNAELEARIEALEAEVQANEQRQAQVNDQNASEMSDWQKKLIGWWDNTSISGRMYFDLTNIAQKNDLGDKPNNGTNFDIKRFYVGIDHKFDDVWSANVTTDFLYDSTAGATQLYLKKAYLQGKFDDLAVVRIGSFDMPWIPFAEDVYGYRYVENTLVDRLKYGNSADWGVNISGSTKADDLTFEYSLAAVNGAGYKKPGFGLGTNRSRSMDFEGRVDVKYMGFVVAVGDYNGDLGKDIAPGVIKHTFNRFDALVGYVGDGFHVGVEYFNDDNFNDITTSGVTDSGNGWSGFAAYQFMPEFAVFGRYDDADPTNGTAKGQPHFNNKYYNVGIEWTPVKIVNLALVYKHDEGNDGSFTDSNGTIGGSDAVHDGHYDEFGLFGQLRW